MFISPVIADLVLTPKQEYTTIFIPDMFQTFLKDEPNTNRFYKKVKLESEAWLTKFCSFSPEMEMKVSKCDFSYFCSVAAPNAPYEEFRTLCDWGNWVFPYDDMFDFGELKDQPEAARRVMDSLMEAMLRRPSTAGKLRLVRAHDTVVFRMSKACSRGVQARFASTMHAYCDGAINHVDDEFDNRTPTLEEIILTRRMSAGVSPLYHLVEYAHHIELPDFVFKHPVIQELEVLGIDMVSISNDIISYRKEKADGVKHNMVGVCELHGASTQQAFDIVGLLLQDCYDRWDLMEKHLPRWNKSIDRELRLYIDGIKNVVKANLYWSFRSARYFGKDAERVRRTRAIEVPATWV